MLSYPSIARLLFLAASLSLTAAAQDLTCPAVAAPPDRNFRGQTIQNANFAYRDLSNADFSNATLVAPYFAFANLTNANFQGATFLGKDGNRSAVSDFSFANLQKTCFIEARFNGLTYFTSASLTCTDFSKTDLTNRNAIFGGAELVFDRVRTDCRLAFRFTKMDCEFLSQWRFMDLTGADVATCGNLLAESDFTDAKLENVDFGGANLNKTKFIRANLNAAVLDGASLVDADFSRASLLGAHINRANLTHANFYFAFLSNDSTSGFTNSASVRQSHLKNVNLSKARLNGVDFTYSNFYGDNPAGTGECKTAPSAAQCRTSNGSYDGFTCDCASARAAVMASTQMKNAYLYGVDFTDVQLEGADFHQAVLTGANFSGATIRTNSSGNATTFYRAFLQGTNFAGARFEDLTTLTDALVDFGPNGNNIYILLSGENHNQFACSDCTPAKGSDVCVYVSYPDPSRFPETGVKFACPKPGALGTCGPQSSNGSNPEWKSDITDLSKPPNGVPPAWYESDSTYINAADPTSVCKGEAPIILW